MLDTNINSVITRVPCPSCRSRGGDNKGDNLVKYSDGHSFCFNCRHSERDNKTSYTKPVKQVAKVLEMTGVSSSIKDRKISQSIVEKFGVTLETKEGVVIKHHYPYHNKEGSPIGVKVRTVAGKNFHVEGTLQDTGLFGQHLWREGGKYITITEGELDALAVAEIFKGKWPVVSIKNGAASALNDIKNSLDYLESFENVIICFDNDDAGKRAVDSILPLFSHNKAKVVKLPLKDAGDMLKEARITEFISCWWDAKAYRPTNIVSFGDDSVWDAFVKRGTEEIIPLPKAWGSLNTMMNGGLAAGEVTVIGALTSVGKTTLVYNLLYDMVQENNKKVGAVFLEADKGEIAERIVSLHSGENIAVTPMDKRDNSAYLEFYNDFKKNEKVFMYDHQGLSDVDELFSKMRWMVKGMDCDVLILDPLHAAVKSDENGTIDVFMDRCLKLAKETSVSIIIISHMRKPNVKDPHDVNEYDMKGSGSINQIAFNTLLLSRDKMSEDVYTSNSTKVQLVKCRRTGRTGHAGWLYYEEETGRMVAGNPPEIQAVADEEF